MSGKRALDMGIVLCGVALIILAGAYIQDKGQMIGIVSVTALITIIFFTTFIRDCRNHRILNEEWHRTRKRGNSISQVVLLNEENDEIASWDIYGKTSVIFGRDETHHRASQGNLVDVDLKDTAFAGMVDREHAVMNYYGGEWYIEDLDSENGIRIQKAAEERKYKLSSKKPCRIEKDDIIHLGLTRLRMQ